MKQENAYKIKLLKLLEILRQDSDEDHYIGTMELIDKLADMGIVCDRRTLYAYRPVPDYPYIQLVTRSCFADISNQFLELSIADRLQNKLIISHPT